MTFAAAPLATTALAAAAAAVGGAAGPTYPAGLPIMRESTTQRLSGIEPVRATNGALKIRRFAPGEKMIFNVVHWLSDSQRATLEACYLANIITPVTFFWPEDARTYTVRFADAPQYLKRPGYWVVQVQLLEQ